MNEKSSESNTFDIYDPRIWDSLDTNSKDLLIKNGPKRDINIKFPLDQYNRHFSLTHYDRTLPNGEQHDQKWLVYSKELDKLFCFCCKLFKSNDNSSRSQLASDGFGDWKHLSERLKAHETSNDHIHNMTAWIDLQNRFKKNQTIDKHIQEQINKEKEH